MDDYDDIFSPQALRLFQIDQDLLDAQAVTSFNSREGSNANGICDVHRTASLVPDGRHTASSSQHKAAPGVSAFRITTDKGQRHKRAKFEDPKRRAEVAQLRKEGACMKCHWNKTAVR